MACPPWKLLWSTGCIFKVTLLLKPDLWCIRAFYQHIFRAFHQYGKLCALWLDHDTKTQSWKRSTSFHVNKVLWWLSMRNRNLQPYFMVVFVYIFRHLMFNVTNWKCLPKKETSYKGTLYDNRLCLIADTWYSQCFR